MSKKTEGRACFRPSAEAPLVKKIGFFHSALVSTERTERDLPYAGELKADSFRLEMGIGWQASAWRDVITERNGETVIDYEHLDRVLGILKECGTDACLSYGYTPLPLQDRGDHRYQPTDLSAWGDMLAAMSSHFRESGLPVAYHEVWNEPDCVGNFYRESWEKYLELYACSAAGLKRGDPDAQVGGPSTAFVEPDAGRYDRFLEFVKSRALPLDFFSMHSYDGRYRMRIAQIRARLLAAGKSFVTTPIHVNELNTIHDPWDYGGPCDHYPLAASMLQCFKELAEENDVEMADWAQLIESGVDALGVLNEKAQKKASYNAFRIWSAMPEDRAVYESAKLPGMASFDRNRASLAVWNPEDQDTEISLSLEELPSENGQIRVYCIDRDHSSLNDNGQEELSCIGSFAVSGSRSFRYEGMIGALGVLYLEFNASEPVIPGHNSALERAVYRRKYHYYPDRGGSGYAYFEYRNRVARLSTGYANMPAVVAVEADIDKDTAVKPLIRISDEEQRSALSIRVDYRTAEGYTRAAVFGQDRFTPLWGTGKAADIIKEPGILDPAASAPEGWDGRVILTFSLDSCRPYTTCRVELT